DPVYQFNAAGALRRAFIGGLLYKAERGRLASLRRKRTASEVQLIRHDLPDDETALLLAEMMTRLFALRDAILSGTARIGAQVPADADVPSRCVAFINRMGCAAPI